MSKTEESTSKALGGGARKRLARSAAAAAMATVVALPSKGLAVVAAAGAERLAVARGDIYICL